MTTHSLSLLLDGFDLAQMSKHSLDGLATAWEETALSFDFCTLAISSASLASFGTAVKTFNVKMKKVNLQYQE